MANTLITKLVGGAAIAAIALSALAAPPSASASAASQRAAAQQRAEMAKMRNQRAHKIVQRDIHADRQRMLRLAAAKRAAVAAHRRQVVSTKNAYNRMHKAH